MRPAAGGDREVADWLARGSATILLDLRSSGLAGRELGVEGDRRSQDHLAREIARLRPGDAVLSEEGADDPARLDSARVWIIDPLDGTREYGEPGRSDWAVHVALWEQGEIVAAAVALPARGLVLSGWSHPPPPPVSGGRPRLVVSRTRAPALVTRLVALLDAEVVPMGSAGAKVASVVLGEADAYVHAGGQFEWDSAAPVGVALGAGLHASRIDGSALRYNQRDPYLPDLLVCRTELAPAILDALAVDQA